MAGRRVTWPKLLNETRPARTKASHRANPPLDKKRCRAGSLIRVYLSDARCDARRSPRRPDACDFPRHAAIQRRRRRHTRMPACWRCPTLTATIPPLSPSTVGVQRSANCRTVGPSMRHLDPIARYVRLVSVQRVYLISFSPFSSDDVARQKEWRERRKRLSI
jgi:hypothetical protein